MNITKSLFLFTLFTFINCITIREESKVVRKGTTIEISHSCETPRKLIYQSYWSVIINKNKKDIYSFIDNIEKIHDNRYKFIKCGLIIENIQLNDTGIYEHRNYYYNNDKSAIIGVINLFDMKVIE
jgi:hypothetical protein